MFVRVYIGLDIWYNPDKFYFSVDTYETYMAKNHLVNNSKKTALSLKLQKHLLSTKKI